MFYVISFMTKIYMQRLYLIHEITEDILIIFRAAFFGLLILSEELLRPSPSNSWSIYAMTMKVFRKCFANKNAK